MASSPANVDSSAQMQDGPSADQLPQMLANMCSQTTTIVSSIQRCHGSLYKYDIGLAYLVTGGTEAKMVSLAALLHLRHCIVSMRLASHSPL